MTDKLYGYYFGDNLKFISPDKDLLQEILVDDYFDFAYYTYNLHCHAANPRYTFRLADAISFWKTEKEHPFLCEQYIIDLEDCYIE